MSDDARMRDLIERSSFGTEASQEARESVSEEHAARLVRESLRRAAEDKR